MQLVDKYPIKQYITGYIKVTWAPGFQYEDLFSPDSILYGEMSLPKSIITGDYKTGA